MFGFYRIAAIVPKMKIADPVFNAGEIVSCIRQAAEEGASIALFPELAVTGYSCGDLFFQDLLLEYALASLQRIMKETAEEDILCAVGVPLRGHTGRLYDCGCLFRKGELLAVVPKSNLADKREYNEKRYFSTCASADAGDSVTIGRKVYEINPGVILDFDGMRIGTEIGTDSSVILPPGAFLAEAGANVILNLSAENAVASRSAYSRDLVRLQSARCFALYARVSAGIYESTTDTVYSGQTVLAENGVILAENKGFARESAIVYADFDLQRLASLRLSEGVFPENVKKNDVEILMMNEALPQISTLKYRTVSPSPFIPSGKAERDALCEEIFHIQATALARRLEITGMKKAVIGVSGGLDSTLALLVTAEAFDLLGLPRSGIIAITMPGFGTTKRTRGNSVSMAELIGGTLREINICKACLQHFKDIGHDPDVLDTTYENVQARERTQILMDTANREGALVVGTGDLSEIALGWSTYNGDHMSMYSVNCGVPKTLIRHVVSRIAENSPKELGKVLKDVVATPVSPELLPSDAGGKIAQKTESILGAYELHDFYLYHAVRYGAEPAKLKFLAEYAFGKKYPEAEIDRTLKLFIRRFFTQQFKRSCSPDGPKTLCVSLSPRTEWHMPSDASSTLWMNSL